MNHFAYSLENLSMSGKVSECMQWSCCTFIYYWYCQLLWWTSFSRLFYSLFIDWKGKMVEISFAKILLVLKQNNLAKTVRDKLRNVKNGMFCTENIIAYAIFLLYNAINWIFASMCCMYQREMMGKLTRLLYELTRNRN